ADLAEVFARLDACGAPPALIRLTRNSLAARAADRPQDAAVLAAEMAAHRESMEARLRQAELAQAEARARAEEERKRRRLTLGLAAAVLAVLLLAAGGGLWQQRQRAAVRQNVEGVLAQAVHLRGGGQFREARELLGQARQLLA